MPAIGQLRSAGDRYYGNSRGFSTSTNTFASGRKIHPEEARCYYWTLTGGTNDLSLFLPYDVRNYLTGPYFYIWNDPNSVKNILLKTGSGTTVWTLLPFRSLIVTLKSNATADGSWDVLERVTQTRAVVPL